VIYLADTLRADYLGCYGRSRRGTPTPAIDGIAAEGVRFAHAYATAPWTLPSHASLFTGFPPRLHGQTHAAVHREGERRLVDDAVKLPGRFQTMASVLKEIGYQTHGISQNVWVGTASSQDHGFDRFWELWHGEFLKVGDYPFAAGGRIHKTSHFVRRFLTEHRDPGRPFFLFINNMICHLPYTPPAVFKQRFLEGPPRPALGEVKTDNWLLKKQRGELGEDEIWGLQDLYRAEVAALDSAVGEVVADLKQEGLYDDTLFIVLSDHGECIGHHGYFDHLFNLYEDLLHVPLIVRHPELPAGAVREELVQLTGVFPALLRLVGLESRRRELGLPGRPLPIEGDAGTSPRPLFFLFRRGSPVLEGWKDTIPAATAARYDRDLFGVRAGGWKLILDHTGAGELYDVAADPEEKNDRFAGEAAKRQELVALLKAEFGGTSLPFPKV
jgi:arylsulfatase A-like enzyme